MSFRPFSGKGYCEDVNRRGSLLENKKKRSSVTTPLCRFYVMNRGSCRKGKNCAFSHEIPAEMSWEEARQLVPCPFFASGTCKYGDHCKLSHDPQTFGNDQKPAVTAEEENAKTCGICLDEIDSSYDRKFGLLIGCDHSFCYPCLMAWRKEGSSDASDRRSCPTCRKHSDYVVPSERFPANTMEKEEIVQAYKDKLSVIPCRRFALTRELGSCPFGSDCFYAHWNARGQDVKAQDKTMAQLKAEDERRRERAARSHGDIDGDLFAEYVIALDFEHGNRAIGIDEMVMDFLGLVESFGFDRARSLFMSVDGEEEDTDDYEDDSVVSPELNFHRHLSEVIAMENFMSGRYNQDDQDDDDDDDNENDGDEEDDNSNFDDDSDSVSAS